jgi:hypothetical protein
MSLADQGPGTIRLRNSSLLSGAARHSGGQAWGGSSELDLLGRLRGYGWDEKDLDIVLRHA